MTARRTPLNSIHLEYGGRMIEFAGWEMPVRYRSTVEEHRAVRTRVGVFDVSHMGQLEIRGRDAISMAQGVTCNDVSRLSDGQAQYSAFLSPRGTFLDDIVIHRIHGEHLFVCVNAATREKDYLWLKDHQEGQVEIIDNSDTYAQLAVQGPHSEEVLQKLTDTDLSEIRFYWFLQGQVAGVEAVISRTGYTGEDGFELYFSPAGAEKIWRRLFEAGQEFGIQAAGLAARNTLRLEMRYPLYGHDIDESHTPYEAGLAWIVKFEKDFVGKKALLEQQELGPKVKLVGFEMVSPGIARDGYATYVDGHRAGKVTSGSYSPSLNKSIGLVYLPAEKAIIGQPLEIDVRGKLCGAVVVETPFYRSSRRSAT